MKASIVIPVYNGEDTIDKSVLSAIDQSFPKHKYEIVVVNDGSTDGTLEVLKNYKDSVRIICQKNKGPLVAANKGFKEARGEFVVKLDADDYFKKDFLQETVSVIENKDNLDFVYCDYFEEDLSGNRKYVETKESLYNTVAVGILFRRSSLNQVGYYNEDVKFAEYDLLLRTEKQWTAKHVCQPLFTYSRRINSLTESGEFVSKAIKQLKDMYPRKKRKIDKIRNY
ncbi:MAG: glycosyltransferase [Candidatus Magasanikbacteria bacterium]